MATLTAVTKADLAFTASTLANAETLTVGKKQYTFLDTVETTANNVHVGADDTGTVQNLAAAINKDLSGEAGTSGTDYAALTEINAECSAAAAAAVLTVTAKTGGTVGNSIAVAESAGGAWAGAATALTGGTGSLAVAMTETSAYLQGIREGSTGSVPSGVITDLLSIEAELDAAD